MDDIYKVLIFASSAFSYLFIISKLLGKKQIAELDFINYVTGISIGSIAAEMATDIDDKPMYLYLISMTIFFALDFFVSFISRKAQKVEKLLKGSPIVIVENGNINYKALKKSKLSVNDIISLSRDKGYFDIKDIAYGIFETNGKFSILPNEKKAPLICEDMKVKTDKAVLTSYVVVDGSVSKTALQRLEKNKVWLYKKLNLSSKDSLKHILLAAYDENTNKMEIQYKKKKA